jgi:hypothetical protein
MITLPGYETSPTSSVQGLGERRHALFLCGGREKRVCPLVRAGVEASDLALRVNCQGLADDSTRGMEAGQDALIIEKPITYRVSLKVVDADETGLLLATFPEACPWSVAQVLDEDFWPAA